MAASSPPPVPLPDLGPRVPRKRNAVTQALSQAILRAAGWGFEGAFPDQPKFIIAVAPHTSNWDFIVGVLARRAFGLEAYFIGKHSLFKPPFGPIMRWLGGTPVRRDVKGGVVGQIVDTIRASDTFVLGIAPEGTRKRGEAWRTGFYHMAAGAEIPIVPVTFDYGRRRIVAAPPIVPTGNIEADLAPMRAFYDQATPLKPGGVG